MNSEEILIRQSKEADREAIAQVATEGFSHHFSMLTKKKEVITEFLAGALNLERVYVAEVDGQIAGMLALSDNKGRATRVSKKEVIRLFGWFRGGIGYHIIQDELETALDIPDKTGYFEFVTVSEDFRRMGIASELLEGAMAFADYEEYQLDVVDTNTSAIKLYTGLGFEELYRKKERFAWQKGFNAKIYMGKKG